MPHHLLATRQSSATPFGRQKRKVSRDLQSRIRSHVLTNPSYVTSLKDPFLFYYCVQHKYEDAFIIVFA